MLGKRAHTKSKRGCRTCKARKVKCDEVWPLCGNCARRFEGITVCDFPPNAGASHDEAGERGRLRAPSMSTTRSTSHDQSPVPPVLNPSHVYGTGNSPIPISQNISASPIEPYYSLHPTFQPNSRRFSSSSDPSNFTSRALQLRLFHHYLTSTYLTMSGSADDPEVRKIWQIYCPQWAFTYEFLLDTLLGTAALHLYCTDPVENSEMRAVALFWNSSGAAKHRDALSTITAENAGPLLCMSLLVQMQSKATSATLPPDEPYRLPLEFFYLQRGMEATFRAAMPYIGDSMLRLKLFTTDHLIYDQGVNLTELSWLGGRPRVDADMLLGEIKRKPDGEEQQALLSALSYLLAIQFGIDAREPRIETRRRVGAMAAYVPRKYVEMLEHHEPLSMAILARYFALTRIMEELWWVRGTPGREVEGIASLLPDGMQWIMEYPRWCLDILSTGSGNADIGNMEL